MSKTLVEKKNLMQWTPEEKKETSSLYGCEIIFERATLDQIKDRSLPNDAYIIFYRVDNQTYMDLCRGKRANVFDMYYDKFGPGSVQKIDFGYGRVNPSCWKYRKSKETKRK